MKLTAKIKLLPTKKQAELLLATIKEANIASNSLSDYAWDSKIFKQYDLHRERYYILKDSFQLSAQMVVRVISKVADAYKLDKETKRSYRCCCV